MSGLILYQSALKTHQNVDHRISIPRRSAPKRNLILVKQLGDSVRIRFLTPELVDVSKMLVLPLIGNNPSLEVAKSIVRTNVALGFRPGCGRDRQRTVSSQRHAGSNQNLSDAILGLAGLLCDVGEGESCFV